MKKIVLLLVALSGLLIVSPASALGPVDVEVELGGWRSALSGSVQSGADEIDVEDDLGLSDDATLMFARGRLHVTFLGNLYLGYTPVQFDGKGRVSGGSKTFGGRTFNFNVPVASDIDLKMYDLGWTFTLLDLEVAEIELGVDARYVDGSATLTQGLTTSSAEFAVPIPMIKAVGRVNIPFVTLELDGMGIAYGANHIFDVTAQAKLSPVPFFYLAGGLKYIDVQVEDGDEKAAVTSTGPFLAVGFDF